MSISHRMMEYSMVIDSRWLNFYKIIECNSYRPFCTIQTVLLLHTVDYVAAMKTNSLSIFYFKTVSKYICKPLK